MKRLAPEPVKTRLGFFLEVDSVSVFVSRGALEAPPFSASGAFATFATAPRRIDASAFASIFAASSASSSSASSSDPPHPSASITASCSCPGSVPFAVATASSSSSSSGSSISFASLPVIAGGGDGRRDRRAALARLTHQHVRGWWRGGSVFGPGGRLHERVDVFRLGESREVLSELAADAEDVVVGGWIASAGSVRASLYSAG